MNNSDIVSQVFQKLDFQSIADQLAAKILNDADFCDQMKAKMLNEFISDYSRMMSPFENRVIHQLVEIFIKAHAQEILSKVDMQAILNGIALRASLAMIEKVKGNSF